MIYVLYLHVLSIAVAIGAGASQIQLMREAGKGGADAHTFTLGAQAVQVKVEAPGYVLALISGIALIVMNPSYLKNGWLHAKLTLVLVVFGYIHFEFRRVKQILRSFADGDQARGIKLARHYANVFTLLPAVLVLIIAFLGLAKPF